MCSSRLYVESKSDSEQGTSADHTDIVIYFIHEKEKEIYIYIYIYIYVYLHILPYILRLRDSNFAKNRRKKRSDGLICIVKPNLEMYRKCVVPIVSALIYPASDSTEFAFYRFFTMYRACSSVLRRCAK